MDTQEVLASEMQGKADKSLVASHYIKSIVFSVLAFVIAGGTFFYESSFASDEVTSDEASIEIVDEGETFVGDIGFVRVPSPKIYNIDTAIELVSSDGLYNVFEVSHAHFWANFSASPTRNNFKVNDLVLIPNRAVFELFFDGEKFSLKVYDGDVYLGILPDGVAVNSYVDEYSNLFANRLLVPRDTQVTFSVNKLDGDLDALLYSKLVKELKLSAIPSVEKDSQFVLDNILKDEEFLLDIKQQIDADILRSGVYEKGGLVKDFIFWADSNLTFVAEKKWRILVDHVFVHLDNALYYLTTDNNDDAVVSLGFFDQELAKLPKQLKEEAYFIDKYEEYRDKLLVYSPDEAKYLVFDHLLSKEFEGAIDKYSIVSSYWRDVYKALDVSKFDAEKALDKYYTFFDKTLGNIKEKENYIHYLSYNDQLFDNLFLRYSEFYNHAYFLIKGAIEENLLAQYSDEEALRELKQFLIDRKIDFLKRLKKYFFSGEINTADAKEIFELLLNEIDDLMPAGSSSVAIIDLFKTQLKDIEDFYGFIRSTEYHSKAYGSNNEERYKTYLDERENIWSFVDIQEDVLGEVVANKQDVSDVAQEIENTLRQTVELSELVVGEIDSVDKRYVSVSGVVGGYPFDAIYDRDIDSLKDIFVYGEEIASRPVKMGSLLDVLFGKFSQLAEESGEEDLGIETYAQRAARIYISSLVKEFGFEVKIEDISLVNELNAVYNISEITLKGHKDKMVSFDILMANNELVTNILVNIEGRITLLEGKFSLEEFAGMVEAGNLEDDAGDDLLEEDILTAE